MKVAHKPLPGLTPHMLAWHYANLGNATAVRAQWGGGGVGGVLSVAPPARAPAAPWLLLRQRLDVTTTPAPINIQNPPSPPTLTTTPQTKTPAFRSRPSTASATPTSSSSTPATTCAPTRAAARPRRPRRQRRRYSRPARASASSRCRQPAARRRATRARRLRARAGAARRTRGCCAAPTSAPSRASTKSTVSGRRLALPHQLSIPPRSAAARS